MKRNLWIFACVFCLLRSIEAQPADRDFIPGRLLARGNSRYTDLEVLHAAARARGARVRRSSPAFLVLDLPEDAVEQTAASLRATGLFDVVERDYLARAAVTPNDPSFVSEWHLSRIQAAAAWNLTTGSSAIIAVIDSGVDATHPDLAPRLVRGWNFLTGTADTDDALGHGTAVAGTIAAVSDNAAGVAGITWTNPVMPVTVIDSDEFASYSNISAAIHYAADNGARIVNLSLGGSNPSAILQSAIDYAWSKGVLIFAAAMNNSVATPYYPAACNHVIGVSATDSNDALAGFSNFGNWVTLSAPGAAILTTSRGGGYGYWYGTSFASPVAAAVGALAWAANPALSNAALADLLKSTADDLGDAGFDPYFGWGRVNAYRAVMAARASAISVSISPRNATVQAGRTLQFEATITGTANRGVRWSVSPALGSVDNGTYTAPASLAAPATVTVTAASAEDVSRSASVAVTVMPEPPLPRSGGQQPGAPGHRFTHEITAVRRP